MFLVFNQFRGHTHFIQRRSYRFQIGPVREIGFGVQLNVSIPQNLYHPRFPHTPFQLMKQQLELVQTQQEGTKLAALNGP